jgi:hypothetical protein
MHINTFSHMQRLCTIHPHLFQLAITVSRVLRHGLILAIYLTLIFLMMTISLARRNSLVGQVNRFLCHSSKVDVLVRNALFRVNCSSHYGSKLWDLANSKIEDYCIAWWKGLRKLWKMPNDCSSLNVAVVSNTVPLFDELYRQFKNFIYVYMSALRLNFCSIDCQEWTLRSVVMLLSVRHVIICASVVSVILSLAVITI